MSFNNFSEYSVLVLFEPLLESLNIEQIGEESVEAGKLVQKEVIGTNELDNVTKAKMQGYEGDPCGECGNYTLVRNGTCMKCNTCGATSGCS